MGEILYTAFKITIYAPVIYTAPCVMFIYLMPTSLTMKHTLLTPKPLTSTLQTLILLRFWSRVSPFRFKKFFACKRNKANLDPFHMCFTISL